MNDVSGRSRARDSALLHFMRNLSDHTGLQLTDYQQLHQWSVENLQQFWAFLLVWLGIAELEPDSVFHIPGKVFYEDSWFPHLQLSYVECLLSKHRLADSSAVYHSLNEAGAYHQLGYAELRAQISSFSQFLRSLAVQPNDRVCGLVDNSFISVVAMLSCSAVGAVWASCSPDFGVQAIMNRMQPLSPVVFVAVQSSRYSGKVHCQKEKIVSIQSACSSLRAMVVYDGSDAKVTLPGVVSYESILQQYDGALPISACQVNFAHPLMILFSSGTTGQPKCLVHSTGGTLLQHAKEHTLHVGLTAHDTILFYTTAGWMMWNWLLSSIFCGSQVFLYDGSPTYPSSDALLSIVDRYDITVLGAGAQYFEIVTSDLERQPYCQALSSLRLILSTGSPLMPHTFDAIWGKIKKEIPIHSISGGSDIISCFVLGNPLAPVRRGEIQCAGLGMDVQVFNEQGQPVLNEYGELVCCQSVPAMPVAIWDDATNKRYHKTYFSQFDGVWAQGDYAMQTEAGSFVIMGRSDHTLNPNGVRLGTAELYDLIESNPDVQESIVVSCKGNVKDHLILFVVMRGGQRLLAEHRSALCQLLRESLSPKHVPDAILQISALPRTLSGKRVEGVIQKILFGKRNIKASAIANPAVLAEIEQHADALMGLFE